MDLAEVQEFAGDPMGTWFPHLVGAQIAAISSLFGCDVLVNDTQDPFLSSDAPAVVSHPPKKNVYGGFMPRGLGSRDCEITLPVSPRLTLLFRRKEPGIHDFLNATREYVSKINFLTITRSHANIISDREDISFAQSITEYVAKCDA